RRPRSNILSRFARSLRTEVAYAVKTPIANPIRVTIQETSVARHGKMHARFRELQWHVLCRMELPERIAAAPLPGAMDFRVFSSGRLIRRESRQPELLLRPAQRLPLFPPRSAACAGCPG